MKSFNRAKSNLTQIIVLATMQDIISHQEFDYILDEIETATNSYDLDEIYQAECFEIHSMITDA